MREYLLVILVTAAVTFFLTPIVRVLAVRGGAVAAVRDRDVHDTPTPRWGGLAMYAGVVVGLLVAAHLPLLANVFGYDEWRAVLLGGGVICALGALDDRVSLDPLTKLAGQIAAAGLMTLVGLRLTFVALPGVAASYSLTDDVSVPLTVLLVVVLVNAVNFVDGLDGLAAGVVAIAAAAQLTFSYSLSTYLRAQPGALIAAVCLGACLGFLPHNFSPARLFMGDSGSMLLGLLLAASAVSTTGQFDIASARAPGLSLTLPLVFPVIVVALVLAVPFLDLILAVVRRTRRLRSPFAPDKLHLHHRLLEIGHSHRRAVLLMWAWSAIIGFGGVAVVLSRGPALPLSLVGGLLIVTMVASSLPRLRGSGRH